MDFNFIIEKLPFLLKGGLMTIQLTAITISLGTFLGVITALLKLTKNKGLFWVTTAYTWIFRGTPIILQLFFFYYSLPMIGITLSPFTAAIIGLSLNCGAYTAEIIRGGIISIDKGQFEASKALGFTYFQTMAKIILPQTLRVIIPSLGNEFISMLKDTSLVSTIAMVELMRSAIQISSTTFKYTEMLFAAAFLYLIMTTIFTGIFSIVEVKLSKYA